jgi:hypothetical protein
LHNPRSGFPLREVVHLDDRPIPCCAHSSPVGMYMTCTTWSSLSRQRAFNCSLHPLYRDGRFVDAGNNAQCMSFRSRSVSPPAPTSEHEPRSPT